MATRRIKSAGATRTMADERAEALQLRLMMSEEPLRSELMYRQIEAFEDKIEMCFERFDVNLFYSMVRQLSQQSSVYDITNISQLRQVYDDEIDRRNSLPVSLNKCLQYFTWFFKFLTYLRDLRISFNSRIFVPLFKYFMEGSNNGENRRGSTSSSLSKFSNISNDSSESGIMSDYGGSDPLEDPEDFDDAAAMERLHAQSHTALMLLSKEFADIKPLYDTSEIKKLSQRLAFLKEQLEFNMDEEESINLDLLCYESAYMVEELNADEEISALLRYIPDILIKFEKAATLTRKWLILDDQRTRDFNAKLQRIVNLENKMSERLSKLVADIKQHEMILEKDSEELQRLLKREERSNELSSTVYDLDERIKDMSETLRQLRKQKVIITNKLVTAVKKRLKSEYKTQKVLYESNRLQRYSSERQLATLQFHRDLAEADMHVEIGVKPHLIYSTNDLQDKVEKLEQILEEEKREESTIKSALIPVKKDRQHLASILYPDSTPSVTPASKAKEAAEYVGSRRVSLGKASHIKTYRNATKLPQIKKRHVSCQEIGVQVGGL
ncbi:uncharacterized protein LOC126832298 [Patella vulgata]|uniref:uncharacterized protein LOC126832298 n=1 Tax=Patella vulgata TaxID=6465 RepID=UPI00217FE164|nr:uncharacterized protein LOC126832298 [Patella vulgata]